MLGWAEKSKSSSWLGVGKFANRILAVPAAGFGGFDLNPPEQAFEELGVADIASAGGFEVGGQRFGCGCQFEVGEMTP